MNPHHSQISAYHQVQRNRVVNTNRAVKESTKIIWLGDAAITPAPGWGDSAAILGRARERVDSETAMGSVGSMNSLNSSAAKGIQIICIIFMASCM